jgi:antitoxin (DNA-binding transcriptional repressor) of toxin-antitoxin stability system
MVPATLSKTEFKLRVLEICRHVQATGAPIVITDRGRPVLKLAPYYGDDDFVLASLRGSVLAYEDPMEPVGDETWESLGSAPPMQ